MYRTLCHTACHLNGLNSACLNGRMSEKTKLTKAPFVLDSLKIVKYFCEFNIILNS